MNMLWILLLLIYMIYYSGRVPTGRRGVNVVNLKQILVGRGDKAKNVISCVYSSNELHTIGKCYLDQDRRPTPNFVAIRKIKELHINKRRIRLQQSIKRIRRGVNLNNLRELSSDINQLHNSREVKIATVNARSVRYNITIILTNMVKWNIDLLVITESWLTSKDDLWLQSQGMSKLGLKFINTPRSDGRRGGGILIIYDQALNVEPLSTGSHPAFESQLIKITVHKKVAHVLGVYHPPGSTNSTPDSMFVDQFADLVQDLMLRHNNLILLGDFNLHVNDPANADAVFFVDALSALGLNQIVNKATHVSCNTLDLVFLDTVDTLRKIDVYEFLSDHRWVLCQLDYRKPRLSVEKLKSRKLASNYVASIREHFEESNIMLEDDFHALGLLYNREMARLYDLIAPEKIIRKISRKRVPWFTDNVVAQKKIVRNRERIWVKCQQPHQWLAYKRERNRYRNIINFNRSQCLSSAVLEVKGDIRKLYQITNEMTGSVSINPLLECTNHEELANEFADFFLEKIVNIRKLFLNENIMEFSVKESVPQFISFSPMTEKQVRGIISDMKTKSCELDPIPTRIIKDNLDLFLPLLTKLVNLSLHGGKFHDDWKCAIVRPLLKKLNLELIKKNYRPVSNLSFVSKLVEKCALSQFMDHCNQYHLLPDYQSAYRKGYSCETCVLKFVNDCLWNMENKKITACAFLDLSAAFDTVDHELLLEILFKMYGISGTALAWYDSYLRPRSFKVAISDQYSNVKDLEFSVPQGSASGANIFTAYCASYVDIIPQSISVQGFADDHFVRNSFSAGNIEEQNQKLRDLEHAMRLSKDWMTSMRLKLNPDKTEFLLIGYYKQLCKVTNHHITVDNQEIIASDGVKCLGAWVDKHLTFKMHITKKSIVAMLNFRKIKLIRKHLTSDACETLLLALVMSHLGYCNSILLGIPEVTIKPFQRIQNMCAKLVLNRNKYDSSTAALKELNWLPIRARIEFKVMSLIHKCIFNCAPIYLKNLFCPLPIPKRSTRSHNDNLNKLLVPFVKCKTFAERSISVSGPKLWNELPKNIRSTENYDTFKKLLKTHLITKYLY